MASSLRLAAIGLCLLPAWRVEAQPKAEAAPPAQGPITALAGESAAPEARLSNIGGGRFLDDAGERRILQSLPGGIEAGVGIFSVIGGRTKERELKRTDPLRDVSPKDKRLAAVGLRLSF